LLPEFSIAAERICSSCNLELPAGLGQLIITNSMVMMIVVMAILLSVGLMVKRTVSLVPGTIQNIAEMIIEFIDGMIEPALGPYARSRFPIVASFFIFILFSNWMSLLPFVGTVGYMGEHHGKEVLIPYIRPATADLNMTLALAFAAFVLIHSSGIGSHGLIGHFKAMAQSSWLLAPIFLLIEVFVIVSLSFRLFGNLFAGEVLLGLAGWAFPLVGVVFLMLEVIFGLIQAIIFTMLTLSFASVAIGDVEGHH